MTISISIALVSASPSPCSLSKQKKLTPIELSVLCYNAVDVVIIGINRYP
jgi:hypothetical protein